MVAQFSTGILAHFSISIYIVEIREYEIVFLTGSVTLDNLQRSIQQFHLERHFCLVPFGQYPLLTIHFYDVAIG